MTAGSLRPGFRALLIGFYGAPNVGDEALLDIALNRIHELGGEAVVVSIDPPLTTRMHGVRAVEYTNLGEVVAALQQCDVVVMGGGGIFQDHHPFNLEALYLPTRNDIAAYARPLMAAIQLGIPYLIWGHGVGPLQRPGAREIVREVFGHALGASVRDGASLQLLREIGVEAGVLVAPDPGWLFTRYHPVPPPQPREDDAPVLAVVLREWEKGQWKAPLAAAIRAAVPAHWRIHWISFQTPGGGSGALSDMPLIEEVRERVGPRPGDRVHAPATPEQAWELLAGADAVFSMRLHASILALLAGRPTCALEYDSKLAHAHHMAGMPAGLRLQVGDPQDRYEQALRLAVAGSWRPDPEQVAGLTRAAGLHLDLLDACLTAGRQGSFDAARMDWLSAWMQQALRELAQVSRSNRAAHELLEFREYQLAQGQERIGQLQEELAAVDSSRRAAHELLAYRDFQLSHRDEEASRLQQQVRQLEESLAAARRQAEDQAGEVATLRQALQRQVAEAEESGRHWREREREREAGELRDSLQARLEDTLRRWREQEQETTALRTALEEQAGQAREARAQWQQHEQALTGEVMRLRQELESRGEEMRMAEERLSTLEQRLRDTEMALADLRDELQRREDYIQDKEVYIAQLRQQAAELEAALERSREETAQARDLWRRLRLALGIARRDLLRALAAPAKLAGVWRRHGWRVALQQIPRRLQTVGAVHLEGTPAPAPAPAMVMPTRYLRRERLLVIAPEAVDADGWPTRAASLALGAARAGFHVVLFPGRAAALPDLHGQDIARLLAHRDDWPAVASDADTRILLAELSGEAVTLAEQGHARGARVLVDLTALPADAVAHPLWPRVAAIASRAIAADADAPPTGLETLVLPEAGDNEIFDSYRTHPRPAGYSRHRANVLVVVLAGDQDAVLAACLRARHDALFHVANLSGAPLGVTDSRLRPLDWHWRRGELAGLLAAADSVVLLGCAQAAPERVARLHHAALLLERPLLADRPLDLPSRNLHRLDPAALAAQLRLAAEEDYAFIAGATWLERAERLVAPDYPRSVSVIVLIHNNRRIIERCLRTLLLHAGDWLQEIVVVDNQSSDGGPELVEELFGADPRVVLVRNSENGCSSGRNLGVRHATGRYLAFFDSDQWLTSPSCFAEAVAVLGLGENVGAIGWNAGWFDDSRDDLGGPISDYLPNRGMNAEACARGYRADIGFLGTSCMFMTRELFDALDGFDTFYDPTCFEDTDICFQIRRAGQAVAFRDLAGVRHQPHQTTGASEGSERYRRLFERNAAYFREKWKDYPQFFVNLPSGQ